MIKGTLKIENAHIGFRNFAGKKTQYNAEGNRNFCVFLERDVAIELAEAGWNVRWLKPRDEQDEEQGYMQIAVGFANKPPKIVLITSRGKTLIDESTVNLLDVAEIKNIDLVITPYNWVMQKGTKNEKSGVKAYAKSIWVTLVEDEFESKYYDVPTEGMILDIDGD